MNSSRLITRYRGALLGVAVGDAFGAPFEDRTRAEALRLSRDLIPILPLRFTDDTQMTIGLARSLVRCRGFDGAHLATTFVEDFDRDPGRGYGFGRPCVFEAIRAGTAWNKAGYTLFDGAGSFGNGAAKRVAPVALLAFPDIDRVAALARETAIVTHTHPVGIDGAVVHACALALLMSRPRGSQLEPADLVESLLPYARTSEMQVALERVAAFPGDASPEEVAAELGQGPEASRSVPTALHCFVRNSDSFMETIVFALAVGFGGDTDTIASMAGALSGAYLGDGDIPDAWLDRVEGVPTMRRLALELFVLSCDQEHGADARTFVPEGHTIPAPCGECGGD